MTGHWADVEPTCEEQGTKPSHTLQVERTFDVAAALKLREAIARLPADEKVVLDFSQTRECHDFALAALVHAVATLGRTDVVTRGLLEHHHRLLRYLGPTTLS